MTTHGPAHPSAEGDGTFEMDPQAALMAMARTLINGHKALIAAQRAAEAPPHPLVDAEHAALQQAAHNYEHSWTTETLPHLLAGMRLALEVYDTFGPGRTSIEDPIDAALLNNKYFVWVNELGG